WAMLLPVIILGGILGGIYTPTEAAVIAVVYALVISAVVYKSISVRDIMPMLISTVRGTAVVMFVCGTATAVAYLLTIAQAPVKLSQLLLSFTSNKYVLLLVVNLLLLAVGMVMDLTPALLILAPILVPVMSNVGVDPLFFGAIMVINLCIGLITPPVGTVLYTACGIRKVSLYAVVVELWPFLAVLVAVLLLTTFIPPLAMWLPSFVG
ncbi:MAG: TRAP-type transport system large permease protein, partial [Bacillota bacterium]|nr:TRAP-type transport system large permease protein [Bacillota bacterium]